MISTLGVCGSSGDDVACRPAARKWKKCDKSKDCCNGATCKKKKCACKSSRTECDSACVDLDTDSLHCGACNNSCIGRATCQSGSCIAPKYVYANQWGSRGAGDGEFRYPAGLALSSYGMVYVADLDNNRVQAFDADGAFLGKWGTEGDDNGQFTHPLRTAVAPDEAIYVTDGSDRVQRFDIGGNFQVGWDGSGGAGKFGNPRGVVITPDSNVYVADTENNRIQLFDTDGDFLSSFGSYGHSDGELKFRPGSRLTPTATSLSPIRSTTASRSSTRAANFSSPLVTTALARGSSISRSRSPSRRMATSSSPTPATTASSSSTARGSTS